jgi:o-succinylbenzoate synthase
VKITDIQLGRLSVPLKKPFKTALRTVTRVEDVLVTIHTDTGAVGYGTAAPTAAITGDTESSISRAIEGPLKKKLVGLSLNNFEEVIVRVQESPVKSTSAKAAVDIALYDLYGHLNKAPVYTLLGGSPKELTTDITISVNEPDEMVRDSLDAVKRGFKTLKVKVGKDSAKDIQRLQQIREAVGYGVGLRVDANQGWTPMEAVSILHKMEDADIRMEFVEQPVKGHDLTGLQFVKDHVSVPVMADESAFSPRDVITIIEMGAADLINIKLMKTGGIYNALAICALAESAHMECMIGCMLESKVSVTAAAHLACARSIITRCDLDAPILCSEDPVEGGARYEDDHIILSGEPGFGFIKGGQVYA